MYFCYSCSYCIKFNGVAPHVKLIHEIIVHIKSKNKTSYDLISHAQSITEQPTNTKHGFRLCYHFITKNK